MPIKTATETQSLATLTGNFLWQTVKWTTGWGTKLVSAAGMGYLTSHIGANTLAGILRSTSIPEMLAGYVQTSTNESADRIFTYIFGNYPYVNESLNVPIIGLFVRTVSGYYTTGVVDQQLDWAVRSVGALTGSFVGWAAGSVICWTANKTGEVVWSVASKTLSAAQETPAISEKEKKRIRAIRAQRYSLEPPNSEPPKLPQSLPKKEEPLRFMLAEGFNVKDLKLD